MKFSYQLSIALDRAIVALEDAQAKRDKTREAFAREWKRRLEKQIFEVEHATDTPRRVC